VRGSGVKGVGFLVFLLIPLLIVDIVGVGDLEPGGEVRNGWMENGR